ncbi:MAG: DUF1800 domain-containing protein [Bacteroidales bacterium]
MASILPFTGSLGEKYAAHLLRRTTFGPNRNEIEEFSAYTAADAVNQLLTSLPVPPPPVDVKTGLPWLPKPDTELNSGDEKLFSYFQSWLLELMRTTGTNLRERMAFFYHSHLPIDYNLLQSATAIYYQNALYRYYALGNFKEMFKKVCIDNAMLVYIDNTLNQVYSPNENFAREMFELYSIGKGEQIGPEDYTNYTETDIKEAARVLTGFEHNYDFNTLDIDTSLPRGKANVNGLSQAVTHDAGIKSFTSKFQNTVIQPNPTMMVGEYATEEGAIDEISQMIDMIFAQPETAKFICRKLYRFFVYYEITSEIEQDIIEPLAETFRSNNYEIIPVLTQLLTSQHFYDFDDAQTNNDNIGALIKSPVDLTIGTLRFFKIEMPADLTELYEYAYPRGILNDLHYQGMSFFTPIDVAGYPPYHQEPAYNRNWITPNYLARRYQFGYQIINGVTDDNSNILYKLDIVAYVDNAAHISDPSNPRTLVSELVSYLFTNDIPDDRFNYFLNDILLENLQESHWTDEWNDYKNTGIDTGVRSQLERLATAIMQSPEYQLF